MDVGGISNGLFHAINEIPVRPKCPFYGYGQYGPNSLLGHNHVYLFGFHPTKHRGFGCCLQFWRIVKRPALSGPYSSYRWMWAYFVWEEATLKHQPQGYILMCRSNVILALVNCRAGKNPQGLLYVRIIKRHGAGPFLFEIASRLRFGPLV